MNATTITAAAVLLLLGLGASGGKRRRKKSTGSAARPVPPSDDCLIEPFVLDEDEIDAAIAEAISQGMRSVQTIATFVAELIYPVYPGTNEPVSWPPNLEPGMGAQAQQEILCLWYEIIALVQDYLTEVGIPPWPACGPGEILDEGAGMCVPDPNFGAGGDNGNGGSVGPIDLSPWESTDYYPSPGSLMQVRLGDRLLGTWSETNEDFDIYGNRLRSIAYTTLLTAGWLAATQFGGLDPDEPGISAAESERRAQEAAEFAQRVAYDDGNRVEYVQLIQCSPWNDALYATYGYGPQAWQSPVGRALRFLPEHYNNRARIANGQKPRRNISLGTVADKGSGNAFGMDPDQRAFAYLWLPRINLKILWDSNGRDVTTAGTEWDDGSSGIMPPPIIAQLGADGVPGSVAWGCPGLVVVEGSEI